MAKRNLQPSLNQNGNAVDLHLKQPKSYINSTQVPQTNNHLPQQQRSAVYNRYDDIVDDIIFDMHNGISGG